MEAKKDHFIILLSGLFLFLIDRVFKHIAYSNQNLNFVWKNLIGWEFYGNPGVAFSLPFPNFILLVFTPIVIFGLIVYYLKIKTKNKLLKFSLLLITVGVISNFIDRIMFDITIDYLRLYTGIVNLADIMIVLGVVLLLLKDKK